MIGSGGLPLSFQNSSRNLPARPVDVIYAHPAYRRASAPKGVSKPCAGRRMHAAAHPSPVLRYGDGDAGLLALCRDPSRSGPLDQLARQKRRARRQTIIFSSPSGREARCLGAYAAAEYTLPRSRWEASHGRGSGNPRATKAAPSVARCEGQSAPKSYLGIRFLKYASLSFHHLVAPLQQPCRSGTIISFRAPEISQDHV